MGSAALVRQTLVNAQGYADKLEQMPLLLPGDRGVHLALSKRSPFVSLLPALNAAVRTMVETGEMDRIIKASKAASLSPEGPRGDASTSSDRPWDLRLVP